ncbi:cupin domain-containing protein [Halogeometricum limi]|uniref:Cupin domain-containing protein n=1 Tax=Halogeometricum limi TaxID=555875 RepID=A0A1I6HNC0_9EURY|nr:cupin domain-containing protein [Halogeometricum limi]SFR55878.1 Cupin domain-containing protein [Halogeometricum limi]
MVSDPGVSVRATDELVPFENAPPGATWTTAFETTRVLLVRAENDRETPWQTGGRDAYGVVLDGDGRLDFGPGESDSVRVDEGEFFFVPAGSTHRYVPFGERQVCLVAFVGTGDVVVLADESSDAPSEPPRVAGGAALVPTGHLSNLTRLTPFPDAAVQQVRGHATGRVASDWHHHGDNDVFGYVLDGEGYVEWGVADGERTLARAGEFFHVPAGVVHRDVNPSDDDQRYVLWLTGSEPRLVRVERPNGE